MMNFVEFPKESLPFQLIASYLHQSALQCQNSVGISEMWKYEKHAVNQSSVCTI